MGVERPGFCVPPTPIRISSLEWLRERRGLLGVLEKAKPGRWKIVQEVRDCDRGD